MAPNISVKGEDSIDRNLYLNVWPWSLECGCQGEPTEDLFLGMIRKWGIGEGVYFIEIALLSTCQNRFIHLCQLLTLYFVVTFRVLLRVVVTIYDRNVSFFLAIWVLR